MVGDWNMFSTDSWAAIIPGSGKPTLDLGTPRLHSPFYCHSAGNLAFYHLMGLFYPLVMGSISKIFIKTEIN